MKTNYYNHFARGCVTSPAIGKEGNQTQRFFSNPPSVRELAVQPLALGVWHDWFAAYCILLIALFPGAAEAAPAPGGKASSGVVEIGRIQNPRITESSGLVASPAQTNVFWTHTDGGGKKQSLFAMSRSGTPLAEYRVTGAFISDWEDISADNQGHLFIADIGNNDARRTELAVCQLDEPRIGHHSDGFVTVTHTWRLRFPQKPFDCESLFIWEGNGYVISKVFDDARAELYSFSLTNMGPSQVLQKVAQLKIESPVTGAAISPDGRLLGIVAKNGAYVCKIKGDPARAGEAKLHHTKFNEHIESCTFVPEGLMATAETRQIFLFTDDEFHPAAKKK